VDAAIKTRIALLVSLLVPSQEGCSSTFGCRASHRVGTRAVTPRESGSVRCQGHPVTDAGTVGWGGGGAYFPFFLLEPFLSLPSFSSSSSSLYPLVSIEFLAVGWLEPDHQIRHWGPASTTSATSSCSKLRFWTKTSFNRYTEGVLLYGANT
jgi:hypothetical protein